MSLPRKNSASIAMCTRGYTKLSKCGMDPQPRQILALNEDVEYLGVLGFAGMGLPQKQSWSMA